MKKILISLLMLSCFSYIWSQPFPFEPDINTVGLWHFNEGNGNIAYDSSGNSLDGELQNGVVWDSSGRFGSCVSFDYSGFEGQRVYVDDDSLLDTNDEFTIDAWVYLLPTNDLSMIATKWHTSSANPVGQYYFGVNADNHLVLTCANNTQIHGIGSTTTVPFNQWILVSAIFDHGMMALFMDGTQVVYGQAPFTSLSSSEYLHDELCIGDFWGEDYQPYTFEGKIDEVRISNIARYQITTIDMENNKATLPLTPLLEQNYPNPFNPTTTIKWQLPESGFVTLKIYDVLGREVSTLVNEELTAGTHETIFNASSFSSGVYFYQLKVNHNVKTKKMILMK